MSQNRYAPPSAAVADVESLPESLARPRNVTLGIRLLWAEIAIGIPGLVYSFFTPPEEDPDGTMFWAFVGGLVLELVFFALAVFFTYMSWKGRNWARIVNLVLLILGLVMVVVGYAISYTLLSEVPDLAPSWENSVMLLQTLMDIAGVWLLFTASSNAWYRAMKNARAQGHFTG